MDHEMIVMNRANNMNPYFNIDSVRYVKDGLQSASEQGKEEAPYATRGVKLLHAAGSRSTGERAKHAVTWNTALIWLMIRSKKKIGRQYFLLLQYNLLTLPFLLSKY